jgi:ATP-dependent helicase/nuclease subunit A
MFTKLSLSRAREDLLAQEKDIALHENWNLFYVALTRAKQGLWLSGVESTRNRQQGGLVPDSWYERACEGQIPVFTELNEAHANDHHSSQPQSSQSDEGFEYPDLVLTWQGLPNPSPGPKAHSVDEQRRMQEGEWFHALLERVTPAQYRVAQAIPDAQLLADQLGMDQASAQRTIERAHSVCNSPELLRFFDPAIYRNAWNELDIVSEERCLRIDRLVEFESELVVLDYKLSIPAKTDPLYSQYQLQLKRYCQAVQRLFPDKMVRSLLIDGQGRSTDLLA